jgi:hypothetical protein
MQREESNQKRGPLGNAEKQAQPRDEFKPWHDDSHEIQSDLGDEPVVVHCVDETTRRDKLVVTCI